MLAATYLLLVGSTAAFLPNLHTERPAVIPSTSLKAARPSFGMKIGNIIESLVRSTPSAPPEHFDDCAPSWDQIKTRLSELQTPDERAYPSLREQGRGVYSVKAPLQLFDAPDGYQPRLTLYRDHAAWCPYCEKVILYLQEKRVPYKVEKINMNCYGKKPAFFRDMVPTGLLPVLQVDGKETFTESDAIIQRVEDLFPEAVPLLPLASDPASQLVVPLLRLERLSFSAWLRWLTNPPMFDKELRAKFEIVIGQVEGALKAQGGPYFLGEAVSVVDCVFAPFLERMVASLAYNKAFILRDRDRYPCVCRWFDAMEQRESYRNIRSDWYTHVHDLPPQVGYNHMIDEAQSIAAAVDGEDGCWNLPVKPGIEPFLPIAEEVSRREAVAQLSSNHDAVTAFACRAVGKAGIPPVAAPLADPYATPNTDFQPLVDFALRSVAWAMLTRPEEAAPVAVTGAEQVSVALKYLQDRIGSPRDLSPEGARVLRAYLGWQRQRLAEAQRT